MKNKQDLREQAEKFLEVFNTVTNELNAVDVKDSNPDYYKNLNEYQLHISECFSCPQKNKYRRERYEEPKDKEPNAAFDIGNAIESFLYYGLRFNNEESKWKWKRHYPVTIPISFPIGTVFGSIDIIFKEGNVIIPIEVKTTSSKYLDDYVLKPNIRGQLLSYMYATGSPTGILRVYTKNGTEIKTEIVNIMDKITIKGVSYNIEEWILHIWNLWVDEDFEGYMPLFDWECQYCEFVEELCPIWNK
jgi:CRISPR/Cas system-associated exonuclease Cas4 (RecB family)